jgi:hypothetical protein
MARKPVTAEKYGLAETVDMLAGTLGTAGWQKVIKPALLGAIAVATDQWSTGTRLKEDTNVSDEGLKQRVAALKWVLGWDKSYKLLAEQVDAMNQVAAQTEPATEGGTPY